MVKAPKQKIGTWANSDLKEYALRYGWKHTNGGKGSHKQLRSPDNQTYITLVKDYEYSNKKLKDMLKVIRLLGKKK